MIEIGLVLKPKIPKAIEALHRLCQAKPNAHLLIEGQGQHAVPDLPPGIEPVDAETFERRCDLVIVFGGDGTILHAASLLRNRLVPILGVNMGHLGFMSDVSRRELTDALDLAVAGKLPHSDRMRLDVEVREGGYDGTVALSRRVLNDAVLGPETLARATTYRVALRGELVTTIRGDGVIISTPTGTTAYAMAAGGSIVHPELEAIAITPISPHQLSHRPLIIPPEGELEVSMISESSAFATCDGQTGHPFGEGDIMCVKRAPVGVRLLSTPWRSYFQTLRAKLHWGTTENV